MKRFSGILAAGVALAALLVTGAGCSDDESQSDTAGEALREVVSAPGRYGGVLLDSRDLAKKVAALAALRKDIHSFWGLKEYYPVDLQELEEWRGAKLPDLPRGLGYDYNPETGELDTMEIQLENE